MESNTPKRGAAYLIIFLASLASFLIYYVPGLYAYEFEYLAYISDFLCLVIDFMIPAFSAFVLLLSSEGLPRTILSAFKLTLPRLIYTVPYFYLYYIYQGFDSMESLALLSLRSAVFLLIFTLELLLLYYGARLILKLTRRGEALDFSKPLPFFDTATASAFAILMISFIKFILNIISEIVDTVTYLIDYAGEYHADEITYMILRYLFILASLLITHLLLILFERTRAKKLTKVMGELCEAEDRESLEAEEKKDEKAE
jgi:hypothetical protein